MLQRTCSLFGSLVLATLAAGRGAYTIRCALTSTDRAALVGSMRLARSGELGLSISSSKPNARCLVPCATQLRRCFRAHNYHRACGRTPWTPDRLLVDDGHSTSARPAVCDDQHLVLITLTCASCCLAL